MKLSDIKHCEVTEEFDDGAHFWSLNLKFKNGHIDWMDISDKELAHDLCELINAHASRITIDISSQDTSEDIQKKFNEAIAVHAVSYDAVQ